MASTLKDVANLAEVSLSTASIVLRGNGNKRKISAATQKKVLDAAQALNYTPDMKAKALRAGFSQTAIITLFWATDIRLQMLPRFIQGLQRATDNEYCDIIIKTYANDHLQEAMTENIMHTCHGIIVCNPSASDMAYLEQNDFPAPIILYNRYSGKYSAVHMDNEIIGKQPALLFAKHNRKHPAILNAPSTFGGMDVRTSIFEKYSVSYGMALPLVIDVDNCMEGGYRGIQKMLAHSPLPDCLFCTSDYIALGALKALHEKQIKIPEQIEIISVGNGNTEQEKFCVPSLSVMSLPMEEMAEACLTLLYTRITSFDMEIHTKKFDVKYIARESCGE